MNLKQQLNATIFIWPSYPCPLTTLSTIILVPVYEAEVADKGFIIIGDHFCPYIILSLVSGIILMIKMMRMMRILMATIQFCLPWVMTHDCPKGSIKDGWMCLSIMNIKSHPICKKEDCKKCNNSWILHPKVHSTQLIRIIFRFLG